MEGRTAESLGPAKQEPSPSWTLTDPQRSLPQDCRGGALLPSTLLGSVTRLKNDIDVRQINRRKNTALIMLVPTQGAP